jgi:hypothetical protein
MTGIETALIGAFSSITSGGLSAGTLLSAGSGILGTISAVGQANYQSQVAANNAKIAQENARKASDQSQQQQVQADQETAALVGSQEAIQGASGLSVSGASQLRTRRTALRLGRTDAMNIRQQGNSTIQGYLQESANQTAEAKSQKSSIPGIILGGMLDTASSLVGGSSSVKSPNRITNTQRNVRLKAKV